MTRAGIVGALVLAGSLAGAALAGPAAAAHGAPGPAGVLSGSALVAHDVVVLANAVVAGMALLRPLAGRASRAFRIVLYTAAFLAALGDLIAVDVNQLVAALLGLGTMVLAVLVIRGSAAGIAGGVALTVVLVAQAVSAHPRPPDTGSAPPAGVTWLLGTVHTVAATVLLGAAAVVATAATGHRRALARRLAPAALSAGGVLVATGLAQAWLDGLGADRRIFQTEFGLLLTGKTVLLLVVAGYLVLVLRRPGDRRSAPVQRPALIGVAVAMLAGGLLIGVPLPPPLPVPGVPLLGQASVAGVSLPVLIVPQRPGWNLVHIGSDGTADGDATPVSVGPDPAHLTPVTARPGASGRWALVRLPAGRGELSVRRGASATTLSFDTGPTGAGPAALVGSDGPECATAALGQLITGQRAALTSCPSDRLTATDAGLLGSVVRFVAARGNHAITLIADASPRGVAAAALVRGLAARAGLTVGTPAAASGPVVVVSGWAAADQAVSDVVRGRLPGDGVYLAPWLISTPLLRLPAGQLFALRYSPRDPLPLQYLIDLRAGFTGETPSADGYARWLAARGFTDTGPPLLYAASWLTWSPQDFSHDDDALSWLPHGAITAVTGPLP